MSNFSGSLLRFLVSSQKLQVFTDPTDLFNDLSSDLQIKALIYKVDVVAPVVWAQL